MSIHNISLRHPIENRIITLKIEIENFEEYKDFISSDDLMFFGYQLAFTDSQEVDRFYIQEYKGVHILKPVKDLQKKIVINNYGLNREIEMSFNSYMYACLICASNWTGWDIYHNRSEEQSKKYFKLCNQLKDDSTILTDSEVTLIYTAID